MNKQQRNHIAVLQQRYEWLTTLEQIQEQMKKDDAEGLQEAVESFVSELETILDDEQSKYDNMPESLHGGAKGEAMQEGIDRLTDAVEHLTNAVGMILAPTSEEISRDLNDEDLDAIAIECFEAVGGLHEFN